MTTLLPLFLLLAGSQADAVKKKHRIEPQAQEVPAKEKEPAGFLCQAVTDLPDGCRVDIYTYYGKEDKEKGIRLERGAHKKSTSVLVKDGKCSAAVSMVPKNISGPYTFRFVFDPNLQATRFRDLAPIEVDAFVQVGQDVDAERDRVAYGEKLIVEMKALVALADEAAAKYREEKAKLTPAAWDALLSDWFKRAETINRRVVGTTEYRILPFAHIVDQGFEDVSGIAIDICRCAKLGHERNMREGRERLDVMVSKFESALTGRPVNARVARIDLARNARESLGMAVYGSEDRAPAAKNMFRQAILNLGNPKLEVPDEVRQTILEITSKANELFQALEEKKDVKAAHEKLDARMGELLQTLQNLK
jgi:hypothetical protein